MVIVPEPRALANPPLLIDAMAGFDDVQVKVGVGEMIFSATSLATPENCTVGFWSVVKFTEGAGVIQIEATEDEPAFRRKFSSLVWPWVKAAMVLTLDD